jgi:hypothetical protein
MHAVEIADGHGAAPQLRGQMGDLAKQLHERAVTIMGMQCKGEPDYGAAGQDRSIAVQRGHSARRTRTQDRASPAGHPIWYSCTCTLRIAAQGTLHG